MKNMKDLRQLSQSQQGRVLAGEMVRRFMMDLMSAVLPTNCDTNPMCRNYGHVIDKKRWVRGLPRCRDCGAIIKGTEDLRKAMMVSQQKLSNPGYNKFNR